MSMGEALYLECERAGTLLRPPATNQLLVRVPTGKDVVRLAKRLADQGYYLVTMVGTDERELVDHCYKLTYLFSHPTEDLFLFVENPVRGDRYRSIFGQYRAVDPFERALVAMLGLQPQLKRSRRLIEDTWLHDCYPPKLYPLRRDRAPVETVARIEQHVGTQHSAGIELPPDGEWLLPVGPVHAGVIEPGRFLFRLAGEVVEELGVSLGYTHKGIEGLFQMRYTLLDGWRLAEHVSGDSAFAHSLAYCRAAEALASLEPPVEAKLLRILFLELERMTNHIGDCAALARDVAQDIAASALAALREELMRLAGRLTGHRMLRGVNRPGGVLLPGSLDLAIAQSVIRQVAGQFAGLAENLARSPAFRNRLQWVGILSRQQAFELGATGLVARASGLQRDFRLQHPDGPYGDEVIRELVVQGLPGHGSIAAREASAGDSFARFLVRAREVRSASRIIQYILSQPELATAETHFIERPSFHPARNFEFGLGHAEGWRGAVVYWVMQDKFGRIYRCQVRDPSVLNWPSLKAAVEPHALDNEYLALYKPPRPEVDSIVPDFPVINKSFNLSYSGSDL